MSKLSDSWRTPEWLFKKLEKEHGPFDIDLCATAENSKCDTYAVNYLKDFYSYKDSEEALITFEDYICTKKCAFMNPPYSNPLPFIEKAWEDSKHCKIVCLLKVDPSTKWWSTFWIYEGWDCDYCGNVDECDEDKDCCAYCGKNKGEKYSGPKPGCQVYFLEKRVQFDPPVELESGIKGYMMCPKCSGEGYEGSGTARLYCKQCKNSKHCGLIKTSGPSFPSCIVVMDRREL